MNRAFFALAALCLGSVSAFASMERTLTYCPNSLEVQNDTRYGHAVNMYHPGILENYDDRPTHIVCGHPTYGSYLHDGTSNKSFTLNLEFKDCYALLGNTVEHSESLYYVIVNLENNKVVEVKRSKTSQTCKQELPAASAPRTSGTALKI